MFKNFFKKMNLGGKTIFIVEDNEVYAKSLKGFLRTCFPTVNRIKIFRIGEMCLLQLHRNPSIVIMDYFLNAKYADARDGLEIIRRIKFLKPETNIIVLSIQKDLDVVLKAVKKYECGYIQKGPSAFYEVENSIKEIFNRGIPPAN